MIRHANEYEDEDRAIMEWLRSLGVWICPICGALREPEDKTRFEMQPIPDKPCRLCGKKLVHGIRDAIDHNKVGFWYPRWDED